MLQDWTNLVVAIANMPPLGVAALAVIALIVETKTKFVSKHFANDNVNELKPILFKMAGVMEKMGSNDLVHLQEDINRLGTDFTDFRTRDFSSHNIQAAHIDEKVVEIWEKIK